MVRARRATCAIAAIGMVLAASLGCSPAALRPGSAKVEVEKQVWDFGTIERGQRATGKLEVKNRGASTVRLSLVTSCDCLASEVYPAVVPPSGSAWISLSFLGDEVKDATSKTLYLDFGEPSENVGPSPTRIEITVTGRVVEGSGPHIVLTPNPLPVWTRPAAAGAAAQAAIRAGTITVANRGKAELAVKAIRGFGCTADWSEVRLEPGTEAALQVETVAAWDDGRWLEIDSNDPVSPLRKISLVEMD
jgi:hypothetical protein